MDTSPVHLLSQLLKGNRRFVEGKAYHPRQNAARRGEVANEQTPCAVVVGCSDSRVPPEILFDQGIGDIYVVRLAGAVVEKEALGSIEYAVERFGVQLIVVLGHERCGAIEAAVRGGMVTGNLGDLVWSLKPAVVRASAKQGDRVDNTMRAHVLMTAERLRASEPVLAPLVRQGRLMVVGCRYDLDTGQVEMLSGDGM